MKDGAYDQRERPDMPGSRPPYLPLRARGDVLVFQSGVLAHDVGLAGPVEVTLYAASSASDTDFTARLVDVYPPSADFPSGFDRNLTDGIVRASYRDRAPQRRLLAPHKVYRIVIRPFDTANVVKQGHRIRLDISSSNSPRFDVNPNTGEPLGLNRLMKTAENTVLARCRSRIVGQTVCDAVVVCRAPVRGIPRAFEVRSCFLSFDRCSERMRRRGDSSAVSLRKEAGELIARRCSNKMKSCAQKPP